MIDVSFDALMYLELNMLSHQMLLDIQQFLDFCFLKQQLILQTQLMLKHLEYQKHWVAIVHVRDHLVISVKQVVVLNMIKHDQHHPFLSQIALKERII